jgi:tetratricopeptide (TPR) repeat protein
MKKLMLILTALFMLKFSALSFASLQGYTADELVKIYGALDEKDHQLVPAARKIFSRVLAAADQRSSRYPRLLILNKADGPLAQALQDGTVMLIPKCMELCFSGVNKETGESRLAFILGHELAHLAKDDDWHKTAIRAIQDFETDSKAGQEIFNLLSKTEDVGNTPRDRDIRRKKELQADAYGLLYAAMAGYDYSAVVDENGKNFFAEVLAYTANSAGETRSDSEKSGYPPPNQRAAVLLSYVKDIRDDLDIFHIGIRLYQRGKYEDALKFLKIFRERFPCREVFNNIGLAYYQIAMKHLSHCDRENAYQYKLATQLDTETRAANFVPRVYQCEDQCPEMVPFRENLNEAVRRFRVACDNDASYLPARINLSSAYITAGKYPDAMAVLNEALNLKPDDPNALNNRAVAMYLMGPSIGADMFSQSQEILKDLIQNHPNFSDALYNLGRLYFGQGKKDAAGEIWNQYLKIESEGNRAELVRERLGIEKLEKVSLKNSRQHFIEPPPVRPGELDRTSVNHLKELAKHPLDDIFAEYYTGKGLRILVLEGVVELAECPVRKKISFAEIGSIYGKPRRTFKSPSGILTLVYYSFALDIADETVTKVVHF